MTTSELFSRFIMAWAATVAWGGGIVTRDTLPAIMEDLRKAAWAIVMEGSDNWSAAITPDGINYTWGRSNSACIYERLHDYTCGAIYLEDDMSTPFYPR